MKIFSLLLVLLFSTSIAYAQTYSIDWYSINAGGGTSSGGNFVLQSSVGQSVAGSADGMSFIQYIGFWVPDTEEPTIVDKVSEAKLLPDGTLISISGKIASSAAGEFSNFFYIQEENRATGIRVSAPLSAITGVIRGSVVNVIGTLGTTSEGEREITGPLVVISSTTTAPKALGMINKSIGGSAFGTPPNGQAGVNGGFGINNIGLLVSTWGKITYIEPNGSFIYIDDGSNIQDGSGYVGVKINTQGMSLNYQVNDYISIVGISSIENQNRLVMPREAVDIKQQ